MDISIIIGLLVALVIVCATTVVNNLINKGYTRLMRQFDDRKRCINNINRDLGKIKRCHEEIEKLQDKLENSAPYVKYMGAYIKELIADVDLYEYRYY